MRHRIVVVSQVLLVLVVVAFAYLTVQGSGPLRFHPAGEQIGRPSQS
jgi:hypothetical protein